MRERGRGREREREKERKDKRNEEEGGDSRGPVIPVCGGSVELRVR